MKTLSTKKLLIICLTLVFAVVTGLFATLCFRNAYAVANPDEIVVYDEVEEGDKKPAKIPDGSEIAPPQPDGEGYNPGNIIELIVQVGKLKLRVTGWYEESGITPSTEAKINYNPYGEYEESLVTKIKGLVESKTLISYSVWDAEGNRVEDTATLPAGSTYFIHLDVNEDYENSVEIEYAEGVQRTLAGQIPFPDTETLEPFPKFDPTVFRCTFDGTPINVKTKYLNEMLSGKEDFLFLVDSESDAYVLNGAGEFHYRIAFKTTAKYYWEGTQKDRSAVDVIVIVEPMTLSTEVDFGEIYYTGLKIDISDKIEEMFGGYVIGQKVSVVSPNSGTVGENAGKYDVKLIVKDEFAKSVKWDNGESSIVVIWEILQTTIEGEWDTYGEFGIMNIVSDVYKGGDAKAIKYTYYDITDGDRTPVTKLDQIGHTYRVEVELVNKDNLKFTDDTVLWHEFTLEHELTTLEKPVIEVAEQEYDGTPLTFKVNIGNGDISDYADYVEIVAGSDSLTQTNVGEYTVIIGLKDGVFWTSEEGGYFKDEIRLTFNVKATGLDVAWDSESGIPSYNSNYKGGDYTSIVTCVYYDEKDKEVALADMVVGKTYTGRLTLIDTENFKWKAGAQTEFTFKLSKTFNTLDIPAFEEVVFDFTGSVIKNYPVGWDAIKGNVTVTGSFEQTNAGKHEVIVKANEGFIWKGEGTEFVLVEGDTVKFIFTINKAVLKGEWQANGKVKFESCSYTGKYDDVVEYIYTDSEGNEYTSTAQLEEGVEYTATVRLKAGMEANFDGSQLPGPQKITYEKDPESGGIPWWVWLLIAAILLIIIIIIIIIIIVKRRKKDDEYDDFYDDEYYGDEEGDGYGEGGDDYGDYGDYGSY